VLVIVDRLSVAEESRGRLADAIGTAFREGDGDCIVLFTEAVASPRFPQPAARWRFTERFECANDGTRAPSPTPQLFSFNSPRGACKRCNGFGATLEYDEALIVPYPDRSLRDGAIDPWRMPRYENKRRALIEFVKRERIPSDVAWSKLAKAHREKLLHARARGYKGIFPFLVDLEEKRYKQYIRVFLRQYQSARTCPDCGGAKLQPESLQVRIDGRHIAEVSELPVDRLLQWLSSLTLTEFERQVAAHILKEARDRVQFLCDVGLNYLTLNRATRTLSGGEAQRIGLANSLGSQLVDTLYVLDEPSIGLHPRDTDRLLRLLHRLRDAGNTVLVVEHDPETIRSADYMVELGPASGERGGQVVFAGPISRVAESPLTGAYLTGERETNLARQLDLLLNPEIHFVQRRPVQRVARSDRAGRDHGRSGEAILQAGGYHDRHSEIQPVRPRQRVGPGQRVRPERREPVGHRPSSPPADWDSPARAGASRSTSRSV